MADISAKDVMALRERMGVSMMACKKALVEAGGDEEKAIEILRKSGVAKAAKKADRTAGEGVVAVSGRAIVKINCETDFVAKNEDFLNAVKEFAGIANKEGVEAAKNAFEKKKGELITKIGENLIFAEAKRLEKGSVATGFTHFNNKVAAVVALDGGDEEIAKEIAMHIVAANPEVLSPDDIDDALVEKEKDIWTDELTKSGKPENIWPNIMAGKEKKFRGEKALLTQAFVKDDKSTVEQFAKNNGATVVEFVRMSI